jgi:hypothetical protein
VGPDHLHRGRHIAGLGDHLEPFVGIDQHPQAVAHDRVVVGDHHGDVVLVGHRAPGSGVETDTLPAHATDARPGRQPCTPPGGSVEARSAARIRRRRDP